jgi:hypothetical protein
VSPRAVLDAVVKSIITDLLPRPINIFMCGAFNFKLEIKIVDMPQKYATRVCSENVCPPLLNSEADGGQ